MITSRKKGCDFGTILNFKKIITNATQVRFFRTASRPRNMEIITIGVITVASASNIHNNDGNSYCA